MSLNQGEDILPRAVAAFSAFVALVPTREFLRRGRLTLASIGQPPIDVRILAYCKTYLEVGFVFVDDKGEQGDPMVVVHVDYENHVVHPLSVNLPRRRLRVLPPGNYESTEVELRRQGEAADLLATFLSFIAAQGYRAVTTKGDSQNAAGGEESDSHDNRGPR
jgi:hypothetical protein